MKGKESFNPTLVRLRPARLLLVRERPYCFNPTLVRLRRFTPWPPSSPNWGFNPTLVRLRLPDLHAQVGQGVSGFNPTLVRLRRGMGGCGRFRG